MKRIISTLLAVFGLSFWAIAQNFPVDLNLQVLPPYSPAFHTFGQSQAVQSNKIMLSATLKDLVRPSLDIGLQFEFRGPNGVHKSDPALIFNPIAIQQGMPTLLSNIDLNPYFLTPGLAERVTNADGFMPEGDWEVCVTAYELLNQEQVSRTTCFYLFLEEYDPPEILLPEDSLLPQFPQNIQLMWQPLHIGAFPVRYDVEIWETLEGFTDQQLVESTFPYYAKTVSNITTEFYTVSDPPLVVGEEYLMRVRVRDNVNGEMGPPVYAFKNQGYSNLHRFKYGMVLDGEECVNPGQPDYVTDDSLNMYIFWDDGEPPLYTYNAPEDGGGNTLQNTGLSSQNQSTVSGVNDSPSGLGGLGGGSLPGSLGSSLGSSTGPAYNGFYKVYYRDVTDGVEGEWSIYETTNKWVAFEDYTRGREYEIYVAYVCSSEERQSESIFVSFSTLPPERPYSCGMPQLPVNLDNERPLVRLEEGDTIIAGDFRVVILDVEGSNGNFSGSGYVKMGMIPARVGLVFHNVFINNEYRMVDGSMKTMYDPTGSNIFDPGVWKDIFVQDEDPFPVISMTKVDDVEFIDGKVVIYPGGQEYDPPLRVQTPEGDVIISGGMMVRQVDFSEPAEVAAGYEVDFSVDDSHRYGFDPYDEKITKSYEDLGGVFLDNKSVARGGSDQIVAQLVKKSAGWSEASWDSVQVVTENRFKLPYEWLGEDGLLIKLPGLEEDEVVYMMKGDKCLGAFVLYPYTIVDYVVNLIPVNGEGANVDFESIESSVNKMLRQGVVNVDLRFLSEEGVTDDSGEIETDSDVLEAYTDQMRGILQRHRSLHEVRENEMYLFLVDEISGDVNGVMPKGLSAGFIETSGSAANLARLIAHELGHGAFTLKHFWEESEYQQGRSKNLMDYGDGGDLVLKQWNRMHNQRFPLPWFQGDKEGQYATVEDIKALYETFGDNDSESLTFILPSGKPLVLPIEKLTSVTFATGEAYESEDTKLIPLGTITFFTYDEVIYEIDAGSNIKSSKSQDAFILTLDQNDTKGIAGFLCYEDEEFTFTAGTYDLLPSDGSLMPVAQLLEGNIGVQSFQQERKIIPAGVIISEEARDYINFRASEVGCNEVLSPIKLINAFHINRYPTIYNDCTTDGLDSDYPLPFKFEEVVSVPPSDQIQILVEAAIDNYEVYKQRSESKAKILCDEIIAFDVPSELQDFLETEYVEKDALCLFRNLDLATRKHIIAKLYNGKIDDPMILFAVLESTIPLTDQSAILDQLHELGLLGYAMKELVGEKEDRFYQITNKWLKNIHTNLGDVTFCQQEFDQYGNVFYDINCFFWKSDIDDNKFVEYVKSENKFYIVDPISNQRQEKKFDDFVKIKYITNFEGGIEKGKVGLVSILDAYHMSQDAIFSKSLDEIRIAVQAVALAITIYTGGSTSGILPWIEIAFEATDLILVYNKSELIAQYGSEGEKFLNRWDQIALAAGGVMITKSIVDGSFQYAIKSGVEFVKAVGKSGINSINSTRRALVEGIAECRLMLETIRVTDFEAINYFNSLLKRLTESEATLLATVKGNLPSDAFLKVENLDELIYTRAFESIEIGKVKVEDDFIIVDEALPISTIPEGFDNVGTITAKVDGGVEETFTMFGKNGVIHIVRMLPDVLTDIYPKFTKFGIGEDAVRNLFKKLDDDLIGIEKLGDAIEELESADALKLVEDLLSENGTDLLKAIADGGVEYGKNAVKAHVVANKLALTLRTNPNILVEITKLSSKNIEGDPLDITTLFSNGFNDVLKNLDEAEVLQRLKRMNEWEPKWVNDLSNKLGKPKYEGLVDDLADPKLFNLYDRIARNPLNARDLVKHVDAQDGILDKVGRSVFFQELAKLGKKFEGLIISNLSALRSKILSKYPTIDINDYELFTQVQIKLDGLDNYFVADLVFVRKKVDQFGQTVLDKTDSFVIETKLKFSTDLTDPQKTALSRIKSSSNYFDVRNISKKSVTENFTLGNTDGLKLKDFIKVWSEGEGNYLDDLISLK